MEKEQTFEAALNRLEEVVRELEEGRLSLEKSLALFSEGIALSRFCHQRLAEAEQRILILTADQNGEPVIKNADTCLSDLFGGEED